MIGLHDMRFNMKRILPLLFLPLLAVILSGYTKANPYLGKWNGTIDGHNVVLEILEDGNAVLTMTRQPDDQVREDISVAQWQIEEEGGIVFEDECHTASGVIIEDTLFVSENGNTIKLERTK